MNFRYNEYIYPTNIVLDPDRSKTVMYEPLVYSPIAGGDGAVLVDYNPMCFFIFTSRYVEFNYVNTTESHIHFIKFNLHSNSFVINWKKIPTNHLLSVSYYYLDNNELKHNRNWLTQGF